MQENKASVGHIVRVTLSPGTPGGPRHESSHKAPMPHHPDPIRPSPESCSGAVLQLLANRHRNVDELSGNDLAKRHTRRGRLARTLPDGTSTFLRRLPSDGACPRVLNIWGWTFGLYKSRHKAPNFALIPQPPGETGRREFCR